MVDAGHGEEALAKLEKAEREHPENRTFRSEYFRERDLLIAQWLGQAQTLRAASQFAAAAELYRHVLKYDGENARAKNGLSQLGIDKRNRARLSEVEALVKAEKKYRDTKGRTWRPCSPRARQPRRRAAATPDRREDRAAGVASASCADSDDQAGVVD